MSSSSEVVSSGGEVTLGVSGDGHASLAVLKEQCTAAMVKEVPAFIGSCGARFGTLVNSAGLKLATYTFVPEVQVPVGVAILVHGVSVHTCFEWLTSFDYADPSGAKGYEGATSHDPQYEHSVVQLLNQRGLVVVGMDNQSYGLSQGKGGTRHFFENFDDLVDDQAILFSHVKANFPNMPVFAIGGSLGGCVVTRLTQRLSAQISGAILLAPMLSVEKLKKKPINRVLLPLSGIVSKIAPKLRVAQKEPHVHPEIQAIFNADPLNEKQSIRARVATECLKAVEAAELEFDKITCPLLIMHSSHDTMVDPHGSENMFKNASSEDKTFILRDDKFLWHALTKEPGNDEIIKIVVDWVEERLTTTKPLATE